MSAAPESRAAWSARAGGALAVRARGLRTTGLPLLQAAAAAGIAWAIAHNLLDHPRPFFAPVAATIVLGLVPGARSRRAIEMVIGVAVGIAVGDLLIAAIGSGALQIALVVLLAMTAAMLLGGGPLVVSQAATSGVLVAALPSTQAIPSRFVDALVGGAVGLALLAAVPRNPLATMRDATRPIFAELRAVLAGSPPRWPPATAPPPSGCCSGRGRSASTRARSGRSSRRRPRPRGSRRRTGARAATSAATPTPRRSLTSPCATCACWRAQP